MTIMIVFLAAVFVVAAAYAAIGSTGGDGINGGSGSSDGGGDDPEGAPDSIRTDLVEWDSITYDYTYTTGDRSENRSVTEYVAAIDGDDIYVLSSDEIGLYMTTSESFLGDIFPGDLTGFTRVGEETIGTPFGSAFCDVYASSEDDFRAWIDSNGVMYRYEYTIDDLVVEASLFDTTLFQMDPEDEGGALNSRPLSPDSRIWYYQDGTAGSYSISGWNDGTYYIDDSWGINAVPSYSDLVTGAYGFDYDITCGTMDVSDRGLMRTVTLTLPGAEVERATYIIDLGYLPIVCDYSDPEKEDLDASDLNSINDWYADYTYGVDLPDAMVLYDQTWREMTLSPVCTVNEDMYLWELRFGDDTAYFRGDADGFIRFHEPVDGESLYWQINEMFAICYYGGSIEFVQYDGIQFDPYNQSESQGLLFPGSMLTYDIDAVNTGLQGEYQFEIVGWDVYFMNLQFATGWNIMTLLPYSYIIGNAPGAVTTYATIVTVPGLGSMDAVHLSYQDPDVQLEATYITDLGYLIYDIYMDDGWSTTSLTLTSCNPVMGSYSDLPPRVMTFSSGNEDVTVEFISESIEYGYLCRIVYGTYNAFYVADDNGMPIDLGYGQTQYQIYGDYFTADLELSGGELLSMTIDGTTYYKDQS